MLVEQATGNQFVARPSSVFAPVLAPQCSQQRPFLLLAGPLTRGNPTCLRKASLNLPVSAKAFFKTDLKVAFCYHPDNFTNGPSFYYRVLFDEGKYEYTKSQAFLDRAIVNSYAGLKKSKSFCKDLKESKKLGNVQATNLVRINRC